jgi:hypothetical protein
MQCQQAEKMKHKKGQYLTGQISAVYCKYSEFLKIRKPCIWGFLLCRLNDDFFTSSSIPAFVTFEDWTSLPLLLLFRYLFLDRITG